MGTPGNALVGYAVLRANYNASAGNYLDNFSPFVLAVLADSDKPFLERHVIASTIRSEFGLEIPSMVVGRLVRRTNREELTQPVGTEAVSITQKGLESTPTITAEVVQYRHRQDELVQVFSEFVETRYPEHRALLGEDLAADLAEYFDRHAVPLLEESLRGGTHDRSTRPGMDFLVSSFLTDLAERDQTRFSYVVEAAKGAMLASVLMLDTSGLSESLKGLALVVDTPVLMDALGFHGDIPMDAIHQVFALARAQGARLVAFDHSIAELEGVLDSISVALRKGSRSRATGTGYLHFAEEGATPADMAVLQQRLPTLLTDAGLEIIGRPDGYYEYGLDENKLETLIQKKVHYLQDAARVNDVISLSSTHRLRRGNRSTAFEYTQAVFVTSNTALVHGALEFGSGGGFPLAMTTEALASILWVRSPATAIDAPRQMLLASAYAGMQPSSYLWGRYLAEVDRLEATDKVSADEAIVLRSSQFSRDALMEETLGDVEALQNDAPMAVLDRLQRQTTEPLVEKVKELEERAAAATAIAKEASSIQLAEAAAKTAAERRVTELEATHQSLAEQLRLSASEVRQNRIRIRERAESLAHNRVRGIAWAIRSLALLAGLTAIVVLVALPDPASRAGGLIVGIVGIVTFVVPFFPPLDNVLAKLESKLAKSAKRTRLLDAGYGVEPNDSADEATS